MDKQESKETQELASREVPAFKEPPGSMARPEFKGILAIRAIPGSKAIPGRGFKALQASRA
jgi:hypothetical protein